VRAKRLLKPLALAAAAVLAIGPFAVIADEPTPIGTDVKEDAWKGLPGAKDPGEPGKSPGWIEVELKTVPVEKDFGFRTPRDAEKKFTSSTGAWDDVSQGTLPILGVKGKAIRFQPVTGKIMLDTDGDGSLETPIKGEMQVVKAKMPDGSEALYYFRLRRTAMSASGPQDTYIFSRAGMAVGKIDDIPVAFLDENNNGLYGDVKADAVRLGAAPVAQYVSDVVNIANKLYYLKVNQSGSKAWYKPYDGPTGTIDLASKYKAKSKPLFVMIEQGEVIIDAAAKDTLVPAGTWSLFEGLVGPSMHQSSKIQTGRMNPIEVKKDETTSLAWGMPGIVDFSVTKNGNQLAITTSSIRIYGQGGEEYVNFRPKTFTPNCHVVEEAGKRQVYFGNMGFGC
jgi:hypothetical protein